MTLKPDFNYDFDIFKIRLSEEIGYNIVDITDVITWQSLRLKMTKSELEGLANTINQYLSN